MNPERWQQVEPILHAALERESGQRVAFLNEACAGDAELRREVESLLAYQTRAEDFIEAPAIAVAARQIAREPANIMVGATLGHYQVLSLLGKGGMGEVYRARDSRLGREVAIKVVPAAFSQDADRLRRFEQEARAAGMLNHPNILVVHDIGTQDGAPYIVSELLEGETLHARLYGSALTSRKAIEYALQIARGLAAAHEKGIVHRDLKPENLFLTKDGRIKILDFGLAKLKPQTLSVGADSQASTIAPPTAPGVVMGTVGYMSPEQASGEEADHRADIFSFGAILYEMLTGQRAFQGKTAVEVLNAILKEEPVELSEAVEVERHFAPGPERVLRRCLAKKPEERFQSASDLAFAIESLATPLSSRSESAVTLPVASEQAGRSRLLGNVRLAWIAAAVLLIATAASLWAYFTRQPTADSRVIKFSFLPPEKSSFEQIAVSPDGRHLAFTAATGAKVQLWVRAFDALEAKALAGTEGAMHPFWSPDNRFIGFFASGNLKKIEFSGGPAQTLCNVRSGTGGAWNRDGEILFGDSGSGSFRVPAAGGEAKLLAISDPPNAASYSNPCFLPDGRHFLYNIGGSQRETRGIYLGSLDGGLKQRLLDSGFNAVYAPPGFLLFERDGALLAQPFDAAGLQLSGEPFPIAERVGKVPASPRMNVSVSDNGMLVFDPNVNSQTSQMIWVDRGGRQHSTLSGIAGSTRPWFSPNEKRFVTSGRGGLWLSDASGENIVRFTFDTSSNVFPIWSPDGSRIIWASNREGTPHLYQKAASGSGQDELLLRSDYPKAPSHWSRDGRFIIYQQTEPKTKRDVWVLPVTGDQKPFVFLQTPTNEEEGRVSPDGLWMAYVSDESGRYEVYIQSFPSGGGKRQVSTGGGIAAQWRGDGKELFYHAPDGKLMVVEVKSGASFEVVATKPLFEFRAIGSVGTYPSYTATADGQRFILSTIVGNESSAPLTVVVNWAAGMNRTRQPDSSTR